MKRQWIGRMRFMAGRVPGLLKGVVSAALASVVPAVLLISLVAGCKEEVPEPMGPSLYQIDTTWTDQNGQSFQFKELEGNPVLIAMIYTRCKMICPRMASDMQKVVNSLEEDQRKRLHLVAVSIDPENDTTRVLKEFQEKMKLEGNWHLLSGTDKEVRTLAAAIGFQYRKTPDGHFTHSTTLLLLNEKGEPVHRKDRLNTSLDELVQVTGLLTD